MFPIEQRLTNCGGTMTFGRRTLPPRTIDGIRRFAGSVPSVTKIYVSAGAFTYILASNVDALGVHRLFLSIVKEELRFAGALQRQEDFGIISKQYAITHFENPGFGGRYAFGGGLLKPGVVRAIDGALQSLLPSPVKEYTLNIPDKGLSYQVDRPNRIAGVWEYLNDVLHQAIITYLPSSYAPPQEEVFMHDYPTHTS